MSQSICADNFHKIEVESAYRAASFKRTSLYVLPTTIGTLVQAYVLSLLLYWGMRRYFRLAGLTALARCCAADHESCRGCLQRIFDSEQQMLRSITAGMLALPLVGRLFSHLKETLEDRAESLILAADDRLAEILPRLVDHYSQQEQTSSDWRRQLETLP